MAEERPEVQPLLQAWALEEEGISFYQSAADSARDPSGREMLLALARDEEDHLRMVVNQWQAVSRGQEWLTFPELKVEPLDWARPLFPGGREGLEKAIRRDTTEREALWFGMALEIKSYELYARAAQETTDPRGQEMYHFLAQAERKHFEVLMLRYEAIAGPTGWQG